MKFIEKNNKSSKFIIGWNRYIKEYRNNAIFWHNIWKDCGMPVNGFVSEIRKTTRKKYHSAIKYVKTNENLILREEIATSLHNNDPKNFWQKINKLTLNNNKESRIIDGKSGLGACNIFRDNYNELYNENPDNNLLDFLCNMGIILTIVVIIMILLVIFIALHHVW